MTRDHLLLALCSRTQGQEVRGPRRRRGKTCALLQIIGLITAIIILGCSPKKPIARDLQLTFGGYVKGGNEQEKIEGTCSPVEVGNVLNCDIYNGLTGWRITEVVIRITWAPYSAEDRRDFRQQVAITPLTTEKLSLRLGTQLPPRWGWIVVGAKGVPAE